MFKYLATIDLQYNVSLFYMTICLCQVLNSDWNIFFLDFDVKFVVWFYIFEHTRCHFYIFPPTNTPTHTHKPAYPNWSSEQFSNVTVYIFLSISKHFYFFAYNSFHQRPKTLKIWTK